MVCLFLCQRFGIRDVRLTFGCVTSLHIVLIFIACFIHVQNELASVSNNCLCFTFLCMYVTVAVSFVCITRQ